MDPHAAPLPPNHHADFPGFAGLVGLVAALSMIGGRKGDTEVAMRLAGVAPGDHVVDVGCGPGSAARRAAASGAEVVGVDPSAAMRRVARLCDPRRRVQLRHGVAEALPVEDGWAGVVWSIATAHHWRDVDRGLTEARRVLRSGGRLVVMERRVAAGATGLGAHGWTPEQAAAFSARCTAVGFEDAHVEEHDAGRRGMVLAVVARVREP